ncbi:hypothetical protein BGZ57DRAFT_779019, partial [Hyaloscypha finlandica]
SIIVLSSLPLVKSLSKLLYIIKQELNRILKSLYIILDIPKDENGLLYLYYLLFRDFLLNKNRYKD